MIGIAFILLLLNSAYLAARTDATLVYFSNVALHVLGGLALAVWSLVLVWRRGLPRQKAVVIFAGLSTPVVVLGLTLIITGAARRYQGILDAHIVAGLICAVAFAAAVLTAGPW